MSVLFGMAAGFLAFFVCRYMLLGLFTVDQNERAVITSFGRAHRVGEGTTLDGPLGETLAEEERGRYSFPQVEVIGPGGPYFLLPWQRVHKVNIAIQTANIAVDPESPEANAGGTILDAVTKDQLNIGVSGQIRYRVSDQNLYAYLFGVKQPFVHVMGYFVSVLRERIATFADNAPVLVDLPKDAPKIEGVSINDLRKNLNALNDEMDAECRSSSARYGIVLDASLITGIDPPQEIESALAAINTAHNEVSANISSAQAAADQTIEQSKRAVEIETLKAEAEVQPLRAVAEQIATLKGAGADGLRAFVRNVRLELFHRAKRVFLEVQA